MPPVSDVAAAVPSGMHHDPAARARLGWTLLALVLLWPLLVASQFKPWILFDAQSLASMGHFLAAFIPPATSADFLRLTAAAAWTTVAIATTGMTLALCAAIPLALAATSRLSVSRLGRARMDRLPLLLRQSLRALLVLLRSVPELVLALLFVRVVGLGPTAGVLAIAISYAAMLAKVFAEILESGDGLASAALLANGASRLGAFLYGTLPQCASELVSYLIYRWECAVRASVIMGFVGAGGLGQQIDSSMKMFAGNEVATLLAAFMVLVWCADLLSAWARRKLG